MDSLLSIEGAARKPGGLSKYTIHAWLAKGKLRQTKVGRRTMVRGRDLQAFISSCNWEPATRMIYRCNDDQLGASVL